MTENLAFKVASKRVPDRQTNKHTIGLLEDSRRLPTGVFKGSNCVFGCVCVCLFVTVFEASLNAKFSVISHPIWMKLWIMNLISILKKSYDTTPNLVPSF